jgi:ribosomal peptide maturation radical SAM protein 1
LAGHQVRNARGGSLAFKMNQLTDVKKNILSVLNGGDILFIVPPFSRSCKGAYLDPHTLHALAAKRGYKADVLYLNILLASIVGINVCERMGRVPRFWMLGERLFARSAHGLPALGESPELCWDEAMSISGDEQCHVKTNYDRENFFHQPSYLRLEEMCYSFIDEVVKVIASLHYNIIWCAVGWQQTNCTVAIFNRIKKSCPGIITLVGGMYCEGEMAEGIASLSDAVDYVFSGEIELAFDDFLENYSKGQLPAGRIVFGAPVRDLDALPLPDYESFFTQFQCFFGNDAPGELIISYETSRGCWKGQRKRCAFCGMNSDERIKYRYKKAGKVAKEVEEISRRYPGTRLFMNDHIFPTSYYRELLPLLNPPPKFSIRYELLPNIKREELIGLKSAGIDRIQLGIEALSTPLLDLMDKGIPAHRNILLLRDALSVGIFVYWYLLWGFPGDKAADYEETLKMLPLLRHLQPPAMLSHVRFERFSNYVENPAQHQVNNLRPWAVYNMVSPDWADVDKLANLFTGEYPCESHENPELIEEIANEVETWKQSWRKVNLNMIHFADYYCILDSRKIDGEDKTHTLDYSQAKEVMKHCTYEESQYQKWAVEQKLGVVVDSMYVPLVTAKPELLLEFGS